MSPTRFDAHVRLRVSHRPPASSLLFRHVLGASFSSQTASLLLFVPLALVAQSSAGTYGLRNVPLVSYPQLLLFIRQVHEWCDIAARTLQQIETLARALDLLHVVVVNGLLQSECRKEGC